MVHTGVLVEVGEAGGDELTAAIGLEHGDLAVTFNLGRPFHLSEEVERQSFDLIT